jgi:hypothetical protein
MNPATWIQLVDSNHFIRAALSRRKQKSPDRASGRFNIPKSLGFFSQEPPLIRANDVRPG